MVAGSIGIGEAWASGGGQSRYQPEAAYQRRFQNTGFRTSPDVSFNGSGNTGVTCFQDGNLYYGYAGTSLACPSWAALIAIADQGRVAKGLKTFNSPTRPFQTLQALYSLPAKDFHAVTVGYNGVSARPRYDEITGRGSPVANLLVPALASYRTRRIS